MRVLLALFVLVSVGCAGGQPADVPAEGPPPGDAPPSVLIVWTGLDAAAAALAGREPDVCARPFGTWFADWGVRGLACTVAQAETPNRLLARAPVAPFQSGPHVADAQNVRLDLDAGPAFGRYDPAFVRWLAAAAVPESPAARAVAKPVYDRRVRRLARVYWLVHDDLAQGGFPESTPAGSAADYAAYLDAAEPGATFSVFGFTDQSERLLSKLGVAVENDWTVKYEANTAYGWWLRRRADGTRDEWLGGLRQLLGAFDGPWLAAHGG